MIYLTEVKDSEREPFHKFICVHCKHAWIEQTSELFYYEKVWKTCIKCGSKFKYSRKNGEVETIMEQVK